MDKQLPTETASTGAIRSNLYPKPDNHGYPQGFPFRIDLIYSNDVAMRRLAYTYGEGAVKYGDRNWKKGFEERVYLAHHDEHMRLYRTGDKSEDHLAHACWNLMSLMWTEENKPELMNPADGEYNPMEVAIAGPKLKEPSYAQLLQENEIMHREIEHLRSKLAGRSDVK